jgi:hypothetical protein
MTTTAPPASRAASAAPAATGSPPAATGSPPAATGSPPAATGSPPAATGSPPAATGSPPAATDDAPRSALASPAALTLARAPRAELERAFVRGATPAIDALVGWELRGINATPAGVPPVARLAGIQKFVKGLYRADDGRVMGYNCPVVQNALDGRWQTRPSNEAPKRFGFYAVAPVDPTRRDNAYLHAALLDYGKAGNAAWDVTRGLRDYLVQIDDERWLGKAYYAVGPARVPAGYFILERWRRGPAVIHRS